jgi:tRNA threonylcarbamoyladenosine biosynthesis protein TsaE
MNMYTVSKEALALFALKVRDTYIHMDKKESKSTATIFVLSGDLGAGKTTFSQALIASLGITEVVQSPTFVIAREYDLPKKILVDVYEHEKIIHMDAYRIENIEELPPLGFDEWIHDPKNIILIEWGELIREALSGVSYTELSFSIVDENTRNITIEDIVV